MSRVLLVTNDFPPRRGGIQSYLVDLVTRLAAAGEHTLTVYAPQWKDADAFDARDRRLPRRAPSRDADAAGTHASTRGCAG